MLGDTLSHFTCIGFRMNGGERGCESYCTRAYQMVIGTTGMVVNKIFLTCPGNRINEIIGFL